MKSMVVFFQVIKSKILVTAFLLVAGIAGIAQQLAFPGAEGGGRFAVGGRGGTVYEVTNLNDSGAGSLRDAISQPNRTIVFKVSGIIRLSSRMSITKNNITIAGQTAPGDGICITGNTFNIKGNDIIVRYIRCRLSDVNDIEDDAMNSFSSPIQNIIVDHCSLSWSVDETGTFYDIKNFTLQWCILSESLFHSVHDKGDHGYAGIWGGTNSSFHHNLLANHTSRNPRFCGSRFTGKPDQEIVDFRNNVIYNWGSINSAYGGEAGSYNMVNNYYKPGPATPGNLTTSSISNKRNRILNYTSFYYGTDAAIYPDTVFGGKFYIDGNFVEGYPDVTADNWTKGVQPDGFKRAAALIAAARQSSPFVVPPVKTQTAQNAYTSVLDSVGAILPHRDALDRRILNEAKTGTATFEGPTYAGGISHPSGIIDTQGDVGGLPPYVSTTPPADTDHDGLPDAWETANSLNPNSASDGNLVGANGYTNLEIYLNSIIGVDPSTIPVGPPNMGTNGALLAFVQGASAPSPFQQYSVFGNSLTNGITVTPPANYEISSDGGATWHTTANPIVLTPSAGIIGSKVIMVRLNASTAGSYGGNITHTSSGATTVNLTVNGTLNTDPAPVSTTLLYWPMTADNNDVAASRATGIDVGTSTFKRLFSSNGTTVVGVSAYSTTHGQAFGATSNGDGSWGTGSGGPGANLSRRFYEQFTIKGLPGYSVRVDSIILNSVFHNTSSGTKLAVVYSKTGFTTNDSTDVTGGIGIGVPLAAGANGAFNTPVLLANETTGTTKNYRFALAGSTGVALGAGQTLTIRLYFSCGSSSNGRYAKVKDVYIKGVSQVPPTSIAITQSLADFSQTAGTPSSLQTYSIAGSNLKGSITITPPSNYEVSTDGTVWSTNSLPLILTPANGAVATTNISVRLNAGSPGTFGGNISHVTSGAPEVDVPVNGVVSAVTGIVQAEREEQPSISPNPAHDWLIVHHPEKTEGNIVLYSLTGTEAASRKFEPGKETTMDVRSLAPGIYFVRCIKRNQQVVLKFIKQ